MDADEENLVLARIGRRVRLLRKQRGLSQDRLALECEITQTFLSQIERGRRNISVLTIWALAKALEITPAKLLEGLSEER